MWTALSGTIYAFFIQSWAQRYTTSTHAAILLGFEAVFAALTGIAFGKDSVTWRLLVGGSLMLSGVFIEELLPSSKGVVERSRRRKGRQVAAAFACYSVGKPPARRILCPTHHTKTSRSRGTSSTR